MNNFGDVGRHLFKGLVGLVISLMKSRISMFFKLVLGINVWLNLKGRSKFILQHEVFLLQ